MIMRAAVTARDDITPLVLVGAVILTALAVWGVLCARAVVEGAEIRECDFN
jgi:hypothetical protein